MSSTCTIIIPLSDLGFEEDDNRKYVTRDTNIHNIDIDLDNPKVKECDISLFKGNQVVPLNTSHVQRTHEQNMSPNRGWWRTNAKTQGTVSHVIPNDRNLSAIATNQSSDLIIPDVLHNDRVQSHAPGPGSTQSKWLTQSGDCTRSHSIDGSTDPNKMRISRERERIEDRMRSLSLDRVQDCWGRRRKVSVEDEVITHGEAPIHDAAKSVIKQVDALLADLQSTTSHVAAYQQQQQPTPAYQNYTVTKTTRINTDTPPDPSPGRPSDTGDEEQVYEPQIVKTIKQSQSQSTTTSVSRTQYNVHPLPLTHTNGVTSDQPALPSSGQNNAMTPLSNNLSELDSLLQDLSSAQFMAEVDRRNAANSSEVDAAYSRSQPRDGRDRTVDSLLYELESFVPPNRPVDDGSDHYELVQSVDGQPPTRAAGPASTATRQLDDLMASLSEFKQGGPKHVGEPPYATVNKQPKNLTVQHQMQSEHASMQNAGISQSTSSQDQQNNNLDTMLGNLSTDMSRQGIQTVPKGHCAACAKPIVGQVITALGKIWHPEHFTCGHCDEQLGTQNFFERDDMPYCEHDYHMLFSPQCAHCNGPILDKCITALDKTWHPEHFVCAECGRPFGDAGFHEKDGKAFCKDDYFNMFASRCGGCSQPIMDNFISALNRQWHPECFVCYECHMSFGSTSFFDHEGYPYCETHYHAKRGSLCAGCHKPITGRCITAMYKKFHPEHFVCAFCLKQLNKGTFKEEKDKPYCHPCFAKLFG